MNRKDVRANAPLGNLQKPRIHLISAEKLIENYKAHTTSQLGFKIDFFGCPSAENRKNINLTKKCFTKRYIS
jgi:hypothetical protein